ncbi:MAG TPA: hypothetical protein VIJ82_21900 [Streptosporangiaceae bacterium]|jgi:hypothetical protein
MTKLHASRNAVCEECYTAEEFGMPRPHVAGRCWTAADLMAYPELRQPLPRLRPVSDAEWGEPCEVCGNACTNDVCGSADCTCG